MKKQLLFLTFVATGCATGFAQQIGDPDNSFGTNGVVTTNMVANSTSETANSIALQSDGKIIAAGMAHIHNMNHFDIAVARYHTNGSIDTSFNHTGFVITGIGPGVDVANSVAIDTVTGKIVVAGYASNGTNNEFAVARYNADGSLDPSFNSVGIVTALVGATVSLASAVAIQQDGKTVVAGYSYFGFYADFALVRYNHDGSPDTSFSGDGEVITSINPASDIASSCAIQNDGKIVVAGYSDVSGYNDFAMVRYTTNGVLDTSFSYDGMLTTAFSLVGDKILAIAIQPDGKIVAVGVGYEYDIGLARYNVDGTLDTTFSHDGMQITSMSGQYNGATSVAFQSDGKIIVTAYNISNPLFIILRYDTNGDLDSTFGTGGMVISPSSPDGGANDVLVQPDGKIVAAGYVDSLSDRKFAVTRYLTELNIGILDFSFSNQPVLIYPNPIEQNATLEYTLIHNEMISIRLIDMQGRMVATFIDNQKQSEGKHQERIFFPENMPSGSYFVVVSSPIGKVSVRLAKQ